MAQSGSAPQWGCGGRRFESSRPDHDWLPRVLVLVLALVAPIACDTPADTGEAAIQRGDYSAALRLWLPQAEAGDTGAQNAVGVMHYMGLGVPRNPQRSASWFLKAAQNQNSKAQFNLGLMYYNGYGVPHDLFQSYLWFYAADRAGHPRAHTYIAIMGSLLTTNMMKKAQEMATPYVAESATY